MHINFSVILPAYNTPTDILKRAINSVLNQTYPYFELIIVDDGSTPSLEPIVKEYVDNRIVFIRHEQNKGAGASHNTGIKAAKYEWIAFICHDDEWLPEKLEVQTKVIGNNLDIKFLYSNLYFISDNIVQLPDIKHFFKKYDDSSFYETILCTGGGIATSTIAVKKEVFEKVGLYDETGVLIDWDLYIRIFKVYKPYYINKPLVKYYYSELGITHHNTIFKNERAGNDIIKLFKKWKKEIKKYKIAKVAWSIRWNSIGKYFLEKKNYKMSLYSYKTGIMLNWRWRGNYIDLAKLIVKKILSIKWL